jgi:hypothetical protein
MRSTASLAIVISAFLCVLASSAAQAQESAQRSDDLLAAPIGPGIPARGGVAGPLSGPAIDSTSPAIGRALNSPDQFTLGNTQSSITLSNIRSRAVRASEKPSADNSCLTVRAYVRPDIANKNLHQNWISAKNNCDRDIKINICYLGSANCISVKVPPWQTKSAIIGYAPTANPMHYQISLEN